MKINDPVPVKIDSVVVETKRKRNCKLNTDFVGNEEDELRVKFDALTKPHEDMRDFLSNRLINLENKFPATVTDSISDSYNKADYFLRNDEFNLQSAKFYKIKCPFTSALLCSYLVAKKEKTFTYSTWIDSMSKDFL